MTSTFIIQSDVLLPPEVSSLDVKGDFSTRLIALLTPPVSNRVLRFTGSELHSLLKVFPQVRREDVQAIVGFPSEVPELLFRSALHMLGLKEITWDELEADLIRELQQAQFERDVAPAFSADKDLAEAPNKSINTTIRRTMDKRRQNPAQQVDAKESAKSLEIPVVTDEDEYQ